MSKEYTDVLARLKEERESHKISQVEMGQLMRMTQSHYSKAELGKKRFSYYEMVYLCDSVLDLYYIYSGQRGSEKYKNLFGGYACSELLGYMSVLIDTAKVMSTDKYEGIWKKLYLDTRNVHYAISSVEENPYYALRVSMNYSQIRMSSILGMDIKKYRNLEYEKTMPDSELLWKIYNEFNIHPSILLKDVKGIIYEVGKWLEQLECREREIVQEYFVNCHNLLLSLTNIV